MTDAQHWRFLGYCAAPMEGPHSEVFCIRPAGHPGPHMDASDDCLWCGRLVRPEGDGNDTPARNEHAVWFHVGCLAALRRERTPHRSAA